MKKGMLGILLIFGMISFVSAQNTFTDLLSAFDTSTVILSSIFIIEFALIFFSTQKVFKGNTAIAAVVSGTISFFTIYFVNKSGFDFSGFFLNIGISSELIMIIVPIIIIAGILFLIIKLKGASLFVFGGLFLLLSLVVYEKTFIVVIGIILLILGFFFAVKKKRPVGNFNPKNPVNIHHHNTFNVNEIKSEEQKDKNIVNEGRKKEVKKEQQSAEEVKRLAYSVDTDLRNMINEYNRVQREDPNNGDYLRQLKERILKLRDELKRLRGDR